MDKSSTVDHIALCWTLWTIISTHRVTKNNSWPLRLNHEVIRTVTPAIFFVRTVEAELPLLPTWFCFYIPELYAPGSRGLNSISRVIWNRNMSPYEAPIRMGPPEGIVCWAAVWSDRNLVIFGKKLTSFVNKAHFIFTTKLFNRAAKGIRFIILKREGKIWHCRNRE